MDRSIKVSIIVSLCLIGLLFPFCGVWAMGTFLNSDYSQIVPVDVNTAVFFDGKEEQIVLSQAFNFNPLTVWFTGLLIAVPDKPEITVLEDGIFYPLENLTRKRFTKDNLWKKILFFDIEEEKNLPAETFNQVIYYKTSAIFSSSAAAEEIEKWFRSRNNYLSKNAGRVIEEYRKRGWYFIALFFDGTHLEMTATDSLSLSAAHTQPIKISFRTNKMILPLKMVSIQPDRDSQTVPLTYEYGTKSENILGVKKSNIDDLLSTPSANKYPPALLDLVNIKVNIYALTNSKVQSKGFITTFADWVNKDEVSLPNSSGKVAWNLPDKKLFLTRLYTYIPMAQMNDVALEKANDEQRVNANVSLSNEPYRLLPFVGLVLLLYLYKRKHDKKTK